MAPWPALTLEMTQIVKSSVTISTISRSILPSVTIAQAESGNFFQSIHTNVQCPGQIVQVSGGTMQVLWQQIHVTLLEILSRF